jgi:hypothetical protein
MEATVYQQYRKLGQVRKSLIRKALDSSAGVGEALIPEKLEQIITNTLPRLAPEMAVFKSEFDPQKLHEFDKLTSLPAAGGAMGEGATTPTRNGAYSRDNVQLKVVRRKGAVTNFLQDASERFIDAASAEMENHLLAHVYDLITYGLFGNELADAYTFGGVDRFVATNRVNETYGGVVPTSLETLDEMLDASNEKGGAQHDRVWVMSTRMLSLFSRMLTNVRLNQGLSGNGLTQVVLPGGWRLNAYRDVPIIESSSTRPKGQMGVVGIAATGAGSGIGANTYYFQVAPVTWDGEQIASAEVSQVITNQDSINLTWTAYTNALYYKIYVSKLTTGDGAGKGKLRKVISAFTYDGSGTITGVVVGTSFTVADPTVAHASVPTHMQSDVPLNYTAGVPPEYVVLWDTDKYQGLGKLPYTNRGGSRFGGLVTIKQLAETDDFINFLLKSYTALCPSYEATSFVHRGLRVK